MYTTEKRTTLLNQRKRKKLIKEVDPKLDLCHFNKLPFRDEVDVNLDHELTALKSSQGVLGQTSQQLEEEVTCFM